MAFYPLEKLGELYDGYQKAFKIAKQCLLVIQLDGKVYIIENRCPHMDIPLTNATQLPGAMLRCRAHGIEFSLDSGKSDGALADVLPCLKKYVVAYEGNMLGVDLDI